MEDISITRDISLLKDIFGKQLIKNNHLFYFEDFEVISRENVDMFVMMFEMENKVETIYEFGYFRIINHKFILIIEDFSKLIKKIFHEFLIPNRKEILQNETQFNSFFLLMNVLLVFSPEFTTIYNVKKEILMILFEKKDFQDFNKIIVSEFLFTNLINKKFRKSSISWEYRKFLSKFIYQNSSEIYNEIFIKVKSNIGEMKNKYEIKNSSLLEIFLSKGFNPSGKTNFIQIDLMLLSEINDLDHRNYYLWNYLIFLYRNYISNLNCFQNYFFSFIFSFISQNNLDYSAFSFIHNFLFKAEIDKTITLNLIRYLQLIENCHHKGPYLKMIINQLKNKI